METTEQKTTEEQPTEEPIDDPTIGTVLVVGAGIAGIRAALDLAETGYRVVLTDSSPAIGGILSKLDYQFPSDHCGMCKMLPVVGREYASQYCMRKSLLHDNIKILPFTEVTRVDGQPGAFEVELVKRARHVDTEVCIGTGYCADVCPVEVPDAFNQGLTKRKAVFQPVPHNLPNMYLIDMQACTRCGECVKVCPVDAINLEASDESLTFTFDSIIFAVGCELYNPANTIDLGGYGIYPNVVTSLEFERILSASGGYDGEVRRPSDGKPVSRIAWLQCVGSRNRKAGRDYCSSICCMFALKEAVLAHEKSSSPIETTIFYMDMRTFGKDFYRYRERAEEEYGVKLVRCRVHDVDAMPDDSVIVRYLDPKDGSWHRETFDIVVLSTGQAPPKDREKLAEMLGIAPSQMGFFPTHELDRVKSEREGVFMCGSLTGLTDIGEAMTSGSAAASEASKLMRSMGKRHKEEIAFPPERQTARELPKVTVILCRWNEGKMPPGVDIEKIKERLSRRSSVGEVHVVDTVCRGPGFEQSKAILEQTKGNRVLFGACLPYVYRQRLKLIAQKAGFNPALVEVEDIRSVIQRLRKEEPFDALTRRVGQNLDVAVERLKNSDALHVKSIPILQQALIVGAGVAGMRSALSLAERGVQVHLLEKSGDLGGLVAAKLRYTLDGLDPVKLVSDIKQRVWENKRITTHTNAEILKSSGSLGRFETVIRNGDNEQLVILHGATIIATGGRDAKTDQYAYGQSDQIVTQSELEQGVSSGKLDAKKLNNVVMIQCVGSREKGAHEYCSRICCAAALKNSFRILSDNPEARIVVLYRDMMTYGFSEQYYTKARGQGVMFTNFDLDRKPSVVVDNGKPVVRYFDPVVREEFETEPDLLVLSTGIEADPSNRALAEIFGVALTPDGFFQEADSKWRPVDFLKEGIFVAGSAHSPQKLSEVITQAEAAAQRAFTYLSRGSVTTARIVSTVHDAICSRCQLCVEVCPYGARTYEPMEKRIVVDEAACQGCGLCAAACPNSASELQGLHEKKAMAAIDAYLQEISL
ncbi:MAG: CoB--CoM heterodisulfide reductase iron-sulfur subunit A family protein [Deltaproteobacteria bacterium]|nr:CoB--CoM heterodisulfide reductase iron-sulfur subunit A family protein [Deltaproteobacteria bacterium]